MRSGLSMSSGPPFFDFSRQPEARRNSETCRTSPPPARARGLDEVVLLGLLARPPSPATASSSPAPPYDERGGSRRLRRAGVRSGAEVLEEVLVLVQVQADVVQFVGGTAQGEPYLRWQGASFCLALGEVAAGDDEVSDAAEDSVVGVEDAGDDLRCLGRGS
ncbi:hypothetical protein GCM10020256_11250 [Streptomyces thermocoprophilus]